MAHAGARGAGAPALAAHATQPPPPPSASHHHLSPSSAFHNQRRLLNGPPSVPKPPAGGGGVAFAKGHQRRQSVARLLPDISKLRLLSWLVEASNELISCDIAIMDGVYAKLNRSRESLLFWQQSQQQSANAARPPPPPPPSVGPVANKIVISQQQRGKLKATKLKLPVSNCGSQRSKSNSLAAAGAQSGAANANAANANANANAGGQTQRGSARNHHSLPTSNHDAPTLAALSLRNSKQQLQRAAAAIDCDSLAGESIAAASIMMMQQNLEQRPSSSASQPTPAGAPCDTAAAAAQQQQRPRRRHRPRPSPAAGGRSCDQLDEAGRQFNGSDSSDEEDDEEEDEQEEEEDDEDDDDNSSAASSTASSGIHGASLSSSVSSCSAGSSATSSPASSSHSSTASNSSVDSFEHHAASLRALGQRQRLQQQQQQQQQEQQQRPQGPAEQLSERIRRAVMEHNYLQSLLVNVIRQHDRQRDLFDKQRRAQQLLGQQQQQQRQQQQQNPSNCWASASGGQLAQAPRIDLADIADALDDGCQCACHSARLQQHRRRHNAKHHHHHHEQREQRDSFDEHSLSLAGSTYSAPLVATGSGLSSGGKRASTLPSSSTLSLFQGQSLVPSVVARKGRARKKAAGAGGELSREELLQKLADKLCENCFETHHWLSGCSALEFGSVEGAGESPAAASKSKANGGGAVLPAGDNFVAHGGEAGGESEQAVNLSSAATGATPSVMLLDSSGSPLRQPPAQATASNKDWPARKQDCGQREALVAMRNATFIKLVQQQVRAVISNSIELIDLIRKEIKSPESIKQKQLMRCFSASIQLLSSVANYVVPTQDISTFIPTEMMRGHQQQQQQQQRPAAAPASQLNLGRQPPISRTPPAAAATGNLFTLPPSDFDHLLLFPAATSSCSAGAAANQPDNYHLAAAPEIPLRRRQAALAGATRTRRPSDEASRSLQHSNSSNTLDDPSALSFDQDASFRSLPPNAALPDIRAPARGQHELETIVAAREASGVAAGAAVESSSGASSNNSSASSSIARNQAACSQPSSLTSGAPSGASSSLSAIAGKRAAGQQQQLQPPAKQQQAPLTASQLQQRRRQHELSFEVMSNLAHHQQDDDPLGGLSSSNRAKFWQSSKFNFIKKLLQVKQQRLLRQQSKDRRIYNNKVQNKFRLVMMDLTHFNKSQQLLATENGVNSLLTSMRNVLEFGLYLTVKLY